MKALGLDPGIRGGLAIVETVNGIATVVSTTLHGLKSTTDFSSSPRVSRGADRSEYRLSSDETPT
jgi:hypothetical protein